MRSLKFHKMEGAGNDFVVIDNRNFGFSMEEIIGFTPKLCNRRFGVGADGVLVLDTSLRDDVDYTMIYRNADGSDAGMCGNGARCLAMYAAHHGFENKQLFNVHDATYRATVAKIEQAVSIEFSAVKAPEWIDVEGTKLLKVYTGTEHVVCFTEARKLEDEEDLIQMGRSIRMHESLNPPGTNVNFVAVENEHSIQLQTYERGVESLTLACGTGALASAVCNHFIASDSHSIPQKTDVKVKGGTLSVSFVFDEDNSIYKSLILSGPARFVYEGTINT